MECADEDDRRAGDIDEQAGKRERPADGVGMEQRVGDDRAELAHDRAGAQRYVGIGLVALRQHQPEQSHDDEGERGEDGKDPGPADGGRDIAADRGREEWRHAEHQDQQGQDLGAFLHRKEIAHHGDRADARDTAADGLEQPAGDEQARRRRQHAAERGENEQAEAGVNRSFAPEAVEQRTVEDLAERQPDKIARYRERNFRLRGAEIARDLRKCRQIHVDRKRTHGVERAENENDDEIAGTSACH